MMNSKLKPVLKVEELPVGTRQIVEIENKSIGLFNVNGKIVALLNLCPHEFAPVCKGRVSGTTAPSALSSYLGILKTKQTEVEMWGF